MLTELSTSLYEKIKYFIPRLLLSDISWGDIVIALSGLNDISTEDFVFWTAWFHAWNQHAMFYENKAIQLMNRNQLVSANECYSRAAASYHWAEFMFFYQWEMKEITRKKVTSCFNKTLSWQPIPCETIKIPYRNMILPGYLLFSNDSENKPCVILINGLDSAKEIELFAFAKQFVARGLSVLIFDGPGQGLLLNQFPMPLDFETVLQACLEYIKNSTLLDSSRIGLFGVSFGGYLALRGASFLSDKIKACINLSGGFDIDHFDQINSRIQKDLMYVFQQKNKADMSILSQSFNLKNLSPPSCPVLCIHGGFDKIFTPESCERVMNWCGDTAELKYYPHENHVCQNYFHEYVPDMCDWMVDKLVD